MKATVKVKFWINDLHCPTKAALAAARIAMEDAVQYVNNVSMVTVPVKVNRLVIGEVIVSK